MGQHVMSTGICTGFSTKTQTSSFSTMVPAEGVVISSLLHHPPSALSGQLSLPHPSCEYALTHSTFNELEVTSNDCLFKLLKPTFGQVGHVGQKRLLAKLARWNYWPCWPKHLSTKAQHSSWLTPAAYSKSSARTVGFVLPLESFSSPNSHLHLSSHH